MKPDPNLRDSDICRLGDNGTERQVLDIYDSMQHAIDTGKPYQTLLDPPQPLPASPIHPGRRAFDE